jgi:uncharacterized protein (TIGR02001 family)
MKTIPLATAAWAAALLSMAGVAGAQEATPAAAAAEESDGVGINIDVGFATSYVFRGWNVFQSGAQRDQHMLLAPGIAWSIAGTGLTIGYWGAYQISGENISDNNDAALGLEQDLYAAYEWGISDSVTLQLGATAYLYPAASEKITGATCPAFLEPKLGIVWSGPLDLGLSFSYMAGLQDEPAIRGIGYLYMNPYLGKSFSFGDTVGLDLALGYGFKIFQGGYEDADNAHDVTFTAALPIYPVSWFYLKPGVGLAWTNIAGKGFADELAFWAGLNVGADL